MCVLKAERNLIGCIASLVTICVRIECCYCLLFDLVLSMVVWDCNKNQTSASEAITLGGAKKILA